ncbi:unnamed protein product [Nyctereutes procyonoides]|uniref:Ragulator complex protein LAMTOR5 n=1 Tax=Nyctereutes procyonoides TaxID=34880 RepID=A0A811Y136_NYCPR|nr:unnamed protein product [Nyctereutes procyonoides]
MGEIEVTLEQHLEDTVKNRSIVGVLCTDSEGPNPGSAQLTSDSTDFRVVHDGIIVAVHKMAS